MLIQNYCQLKTFRNHKSGLRKRVSLQYQDGLKITHLVLFNLSSFLDMELCRSNGSFFFFFSAIMSFIL